MRRQGQWRMCPSTWRTSSVCNRTTCSLPSRWSSNCMLMAPACMLMAPGCMLMAHALSLAGSRRGALHRHRQPYSLACLCAIPSAPPVAASHERESRSRQARRHPTGRGASTATCHRATLLAPYARPDRRAHAQEPRVLIYEFGGVRDWPAGCTAPAAPRYYMPRDTIRPTTPPSLRARRISSAAWLRANHRRPSPSGASRRISAAPCPSI